MIIDPTALAYGFVGLSAGTGVHFWNRKKELEERCEFLAEMGRDLSLAFETVSSVLDDKNTPKPIREVILLLLAAHADPERGRVIALTLMELRQKRDRQAADGKDPISQSMSVLGRHNPALARQTHHVLASLTFGLVFVNLANSIKIERVKDEAAKDPVTLWARIARLFGTSNDQDHHEGRGLLPA